MNGSREQEGGVIAMRRPLVLAIGMVMIATLLLAAPAQATFPGANGLIAFAAYPTPDALGKQIFTIEPNGTDLRQITFGDGDTIFPHWSPDGNLIVFELDHPTGEPFCSVEIMNADGSSPVDLTGDRNGCEGAPSFTPDGSRIIFDRFDDITNVEGFWTMNLTGGDRQEITPVRCCIMPEVSPDGTTVSFENFNPNGDGQALFTCNIDGSNLHQLTGYSNIGDKQSWAPDGSRIVLSFNVDYPDHLSANVATIAPDGSDLQYLTHYAGGRAGAISGSYSPDGQWIVYRLDQGKNPTTYGLWMMRPDGTQRTLIAELPFKPRTTDWGTHP